MDGTDVYLYVYDLSAGLAEILSPFFLGKNIEGIWHTSVVAFGKEFYFGQSGISEDYPECTSAGSPKNKLLMGTTEIPETLFRDYLMSARNGEFAGSRYDLLHHNCNNFSDEMCQFLVGRSIPEYILKLPKDILDSAPLVLSLIAGSGPTHRDTSPDYENLNHDIDEARQRSAVLEQKRNKIKEKVDRLERKKRKKKKQYEKICFERNHHIDDLGSPEHSQSVGNKLLYSRCMMAESGQTSDTLQNGNDKDVVDIAAQIEEKEKEEREEKKKQREPPIVFSSIINVQEEFDKVLGLVDGNVATNEMQFFEELHQYMLEDEGSWAIGDGFLSFVGKLLNDQKFPEELRVRLLKLLAMAALKEDIILVLHQDRREHVFMNYANNFERLPLQEQISLALFVCNLFENPSSSEWLLYISEWDSNNGSISNIRITTKIAANSLLSEDGDLQNYGSAIIHNLACKEKLHHGKHLRKLLPVGCISKVFDDVAVELTMAVLQFFNSKPNEENVFRCMKALSKFIDVSQQEVSQLINMIGPQPDKFKALSPRVDELVSTIKTKIR